MKYIYIIEIGIPFDSSFVIAGYTKNKESAVKYLKRKGYPRYNKRYDYYENDYEGSWSRIVKVNEITQPECEHAAT